MQVRHILQGKGRDVVTVAQSVSLESAARLLTQHRIGALVVVDGRGALAGILSERDLVRAVAEDGPLAFNRNAGAYMSRQISTCRENDTVEELMEMMTRGRFRHVPVLDDDDKLAGMISIGDVVKTRIAETVNEANAMRDYIAAVV